MMETEYFLDPHQYGKSMWKYEWTVVVYVNQAHVNPNSSVKQPPAACVGACLGSACAPACAPGDNGLC